MPADPNKLPSPAPFPSQEVRQEREAKVAARRGRPRTHAEVTDKWMARRMISFRLEHAHWHNIRWFARKDGISKGEYMKQAIMLYNYINWKYPLNKRLLLDLNDRLELYLEFYRKCLSQSVGDPMVGIQAILEAPYNGGRQLTDEEKKIVRAINHNIEDLKYAKSKTACEGEGQIPVSREEGCEEEVSGSIAQSNVSAGAAL